MPTTSRITLTLTNSRGTAAEAVKQVAAGIPKFAGECGRPASFGIEALIAGRPEAPEPMPGLISYKGGGDRPNCIAPRGVAS